MTAGKFLRYLVLGESLKFTGKHWDTIMDFIRTHPVLFALLVIFVIAIIVGLTLAYKKKKRSAVTNPDSSLD